MLRHFARMHEGVKLYRQAEHALREFRAERSPVCRNRRKRMGGAGAPPRRSRGALCHWIEVQGGKIKNYQIITPTTWNVGPRSDRDELGPIEQALIGTPVADANDPVEVGHVCRSYDSVPRLYCARPSRQHGQGTCTFPHGLVGLRRLTTCLIITSRVMERRRNIGATADEQRATTRTAPPNGRPHGGRSEDATEPSSETEREFAGILDEAAQA